MQSTSSSRAGTALYSPVLYRTVNHLCHALCTVQCSAALIPRETILYSTATHSGPNWCVPVSVLLFISSSSRSTQASVIALPVPPLPPGWCTLYCTVQCCGEGVLYFTLQHHPPAQTPSGLHRRLFSVCCEPLYALLLLVGAVSQKAREYSAVISHTQALIGLRWPPIPL